jgi:hypothetical protein
MKGNYLYDSALNLIQALTQNGSRVLTQVHCILSSFFPMGGLTDMPRGAVAVPAGRFSYPRGGSRTRGAVPVPAGRFPYPRGGCRTRGAVAVHEIHRNSMKSMEIH